MKNIKNIEIVFENCECVQIDEKDIIYIILKDINSEIRRVACNSISKIKFSDYIGILVSKNAKIKYTCGFQDEDYNAKDRLIGSDDITWIYMNYDDGSEESYCVDWEDGENEYINKNQKIFVDKFNNIGICLGENLKDIEKDLNEISERWSPYMEDD